MLKDSIKCHSYIVTTMLLVFFFGGSSWVHIANYTLFFRFGGFWATYSIISSMDSLVFKLGNLNTFSTFSYDLDVDRDRSVPMDLVSFWAGNRFNWELFVVLDGDRSELIVALGCGWGELFIVLDDGASYGLSLCLSYIFAFYYLALSSS